MCWYSYKHKLKTLSKFPANFLSLKEGEKRRLFSDFLRELWAQDASKYNKYTLDLILMLVNIILHYGKAMALELRWDVIYLGGESSSRDVKRKYICRWNEKSLNGFSGVCPRRCFILIKQLFIEWVKEWKKVFALVFSERKQWTLNTEQCEDSDKENISISNIYSVFLAASNVTRSVGDTRKKRKKKKPSEHSSFQTMIAYCVSVYGEWTNTRNASRKKSKYL